MNGVLLRNETSGDSRRRMGVVDVIVFGTSKTLNERFTQEEPRRVSIVDGGRSTSHENNQRGTLVVREMNRPPMTNATIREEALSVKGKNGKRNRRKRKRKGSRASGKRRVVLAGNALLITPPKQRKTPTEPCKTVDEDHDSAPASSGATSAKSRRKRNRRRLYRDLVRSAADACSRASALCGGTEPIVFSPFLYGRQCLVEQKSVTKEHLDDELDRYMSRAQFEGCGPPPTERGTESEDFVSDEGCGLGLMFE